MAKKRGRHTAACTLRVALAAQEGSQTMRRFAREHQVQANLIQTGRRQRLVDGPRVCVRYGERNQRARETHKAARYAQRGRLKMALAWSKWSKKGLPASVRERRRLVAAAAPALRGQCQDEPLGLNRGASSYQAVTEAPLPLPLMSLMAEPRPRTLCSG